MTNSKVIKIREITEGCMPEQYGDALDLKCAETLYIEKGYRAKIKLGVAMEIPEGYYALLLPRSSTADKFHIIQTNSIGLIDNDYKGDDEEWAMPILALETTCINKGDRVCQFLIQKKTPIELLQVETLGNDNRGGFGSTGV